MEQNERGRMEQSVPTEAVERAAKGDAAALAELYQRFHPRILRLCRYLLNVPEEAEDAASEVFARLPKAMATYDFTQDFPRWLMAVASNHCLDLLRRRRVGQRIFEPVDDNAEFPSSDGSALEKVLENERADRVRAALSRLHERLRAPLVLRYYNDLSYDEIAAQLQLTRANVAVLIFRAKQELRRTLAAPGPEKIP